MQGMDEAEVAKGLAKERTEALSMVSRRPLTVLNMKPTVAILILILILIVFLYSFVDVDERFRVHHGFGIREEE